MRFLTLLLFTLTAQVAFGQTMIIKEDFDNNLNEWPFIQTYDISDASIEGGQLTWVNKSDKQYQSTYLFSNEDWNKNFRITSRIRITSGERQFFSGILFSTSKDRNTYYRFGFADTGYWQFVEMTDGKVVRDETGWHRSEVVKQQDFNKIEIRKLGEYFFFSINDQVVHYEKGLRKKDSYLAINFPNKATSVVDYIYSEQTDENEKETEKVQQEIFEKLAEEKILLNESFDNNSNEWPYLTDSELGEGMFSNGALTYKNLSKGYIQSSKIVSLNWAMDFTIEARLKRLAGRTDNLYGITFSFHNWDNYYYYGFAPSGYWKLKKQKDQKKQYTTGWVKSKEVKANDYNDLKIMKVGDRLLFFMNDKLVHNRVEKERLGNNIGMMICDSAVAVFDELIVTQQYRSEKEQEKLLKKYTGIDKSKDQNAERIGDKKHQKHKARLLESWRGKPISALRKAWGSPIKSNSYRDIFRYKTVGGKQYYYEVVFFENGGKYGPVVSDIRFTSNPY